MTPVFAFLSMGPGELVIVGIIAVLLFGERLPEVGRSLGRSLIEFRKGLHEIQNEFHRSVESSSPEPREIASELDREEPTAPRFEPPRAEPRDASELKAT
ncbi:MAG: twin-arginine translocase TatA/TatE family subunit [Pirellulales bacterium]|nr:twin-arginine translocase TatA/TatE family subunit [Pirellulales bacterium]